METNTQKGSARTVGDYDEAHLRQIVIYQETPLEKRTRSSPYQANFVADGQGMIVEQRDKHSNFFERQMSS